MNMQSQVLQLHEAEGIKSDPEVGLFVDIAVDSFRQ